MPQIKHRSDKSYGVQNLRYSQPDVARCRAAEFCTAQMCSIVTDANVSNVIFRQLLGVARAVNRGGATPEYATLPQHRYGSLSSFTWPHKSGSKFVFHEDAAWIKLFL